MSSGGPGGLPILGQPSSWPPPTPEVIGVIIASPQLLPESCAHPLQQLEGVSNTSSHIKSLPGTSFTPLQGVLCSFECQRNWAPCSGTRTLSWTVFAPLQSAAAARERVLVLFSAEWCLGVFVPLYPPYPSMCGQEL